jgi:hypothetical protein
LKSHRSTDIKLGTLIHLKKSINHIHFEVNR